MTCHLIFPGQFRVTNDPRLVLQACLGSCIAVAMYDYDAVIGGLLHIVLPIGSEEAEKIAPARYARSGIPMLLSEMIKLGASKERTVAAIAGGASVVADKKMNVNINIGERNLGTVRRVLSTQRIPVAAENVGGHSCRIFRLNVATGRTEVKAVGAGKHKAPTCGTKGEIRWTVLKKRIDQLKPLPGIARKIISGIEDSESSLSDLEQYILKDQALTANVLKVCNSAYYGFQYRISSIKRAVSLIGSKTLKNIVLAAALYDLYNDRFDGYSLRKGELMKHSLCCAMVAELIASEKKIKDLDVVFTAGLLHDMGKVVLDQYAFEKFNLIMDLVINENVPFLGAENRILGYDHAQVGGLVAKEWNLPEVLREAVSFHHQPEKAEENPEVVSIVHIADVISSMVGVGAGADGLANRVHQFAVSTINLQTDDVYRIVEKLPELAREAEVF